MDSTPVEIRRLSAGDSFGEVSLITVISRLQFPSFALRLSYFPWRSQALIRLRLFRKGLPQAVRAIACEETTVLELKRGITTKIHFVFFFFPHMLVSTPDNFQQLLMQFQNIRYHILNCISERLKVTAAMILFFFL